MRDRPPGLTETELTGALAAGWNIEAGRWVLRWPCAATPDWTSSLRPRR